MPRPDIADLLVSYDQSLTTTACFSSACFIPSVIRLSTVKTSSFHSTGSLTHLSPYKPAVWLGAYISPSLTNISKHPTPTCQTPWHSFRLQSIKKHEFTDVMASIGACWKTYIPMTALKKLLLCFPHWTNTPEERWLTKLPSKLVFYKGWNQKSYNYNKNGTRKKNHERLNCDWGLTAFQHSNRRE